LIVAFGPPRPIFDRRRDPRADWWASPAALRIAIGIILVLFSAYSLWRPKLGWASGAGPVADGGIGILNGVIGGATGLAGIAATVWCGRLWSREPSSNRSASRCL
jgi:hypothetical protein